MNIPNIRRLSLPEISPLHKWPPPLKRFIRFFFIILVIVSYGLLLGGIAALLVFLANAL